MSFMERRSRKQAKQTAAEVEKADLANALHKSNKSAFEHQQKQIEIDRQTEQALSLSQTSAQEENLANANLDCQVDKALKLLTSTWSTPLSLKLVQRNGLCLYHCACIMRYPKEDKPEKFLETMRSMIIDHVTKSQCWQRFKPHLEEGEDAWSTKEYKQRMENGRQGGALELLALSEMFKVCVNILRFNFETNTMNPAMVLAGNSSMAQWYFVYLAPDPKSMKNHYHLAMPSPAAVPTTTPTCTTPTT